MKSNLQYIFDRITRRAVTAEELEKLDRVALINLAIAIGAADRGVTITTERAGLVAETVVAPKQWKRNSPSRRVMTTLPVSQPNSRRTERMYAEASLLRGGAS